MTLRDKMEVIRLELPPWGYCVKKRHSVLQSPKWEHLPQFATVEEHGTGNPVTLRKHDGELICELAYDVFRRVYTID